MAYYFLAQIKINDKSEYQLYLNSTEKVFSKFNGKYLAVDKNPLVLEGDWKYSRSVIIRFETKLDFESWYNSKEYQEILKHRLKAADCDTILVEGLDV